MVFVVMRMRESSLISKIWQTIMKSEPEGFRKGEGQRLERLPQDYKRLLRRDKSWKKAEKRGETTLDSKNKTSLIDILFALNSCVFI